MPPVNTPLVNDDGTMNLTWYRFFIALLVKSGLNPNANGSNPNRIGVPTSGNRVIAGHLYHGGVNASVSYSTDVSTSLNVYDVTTGQFMGQIDFTRVFTP